MTAVTTYMATDLITGRVLADSLPLNVQSFSMQLNGGGTLTGALNLDEVYSVNAPFVAALECRRAVLWALQDDYPVWNGVVWDWPHMSLQGGNLPVSAQTMDSVFAHRLISATLDYEAVDLFGVFIDLAQYGISKSSPYITTLSPVQGPPSPLVAQAAAVAGLIMPAGAAAVSGIPWSMTCQYSDLSQVSDQFQTLCASGKLEYAFVPGLDSSGNLATYLQLSINGLGRSVQESGYSLVYPGNVLDYGYQRTGSQSSNYVYGTAPPNGAPVQWESQYSHGVLLADLEAGYPLMESTVSMTGSLVTMQSQVDDFADGQVLLTSALMTQPVVNIGGAGFPRLADIVLGDWAWLSATSAIHPPGPNGEPGLQMPVRVTGWTCYPEGPQQTPYIQLTTTGVAL